MNQFMINIVKNTDRDKHSVDCFGICSFYNTYKV